MDFKAYDPDNVGGLIKSVESVKSKTQGYQMKMEFALKPTASTFAWDSSLVAALWVSD